MHLDHLSDFIQKFLLFETPRPSTPEPCPSEAPTVETLV